MLAWVALDALEDGIVLAVSGKQAHMVAFSGFDDKGTAEHEEFFIGEGDIFASFDRCQRWLESACADDCDEHDVGFG